jgi:hypothetical protein
MSIESAIKKFPSYFPKGIVPTEAYREKAEIDVYRLCLWGCVEERAFLNTYETNIRQMRVKCNKPEDPQTYSMSCFDRIKEVEKLLIFQMRRYNDPPPVIAKGKTSTEHGPWCRTKEWKEKSGDKDKHHIDWWLYENENPWNKFEPV